MPKLWQTLTLDNFATNSKAQQQLKKSAINFLTSDHGLFISSPAGTGKTHLAVAVYNETYRENKYDYSTYLPAGNIKIVSIPELMLQLRTNVGFNSRENELVEKYAACEYLILDDLGAEKIKDNTIETLYLILDRRYKNVKHKILITSNLSIKEIESNFNDRIASRITEMCEICTVKATDYRLSLNRKSVAITKDRIKQIDEAREKQQELDRIKRDKDREDLRLQQEKEEADRKGTEEKERAEQDIINQQNQLKNNIVLQQLEKVRAEQQKIQDEEKARIKFVHDCWLKCPPDLLNKIVNEENPDLKAALRQQTEEKLIAEARRIAKEIN